MNILQLFLSFVQVGLFSVGGGYAAVPLIKAQVVDKFGWLTMNEFSDLLTIAEMTPGPIAVNAATFVGTRIAGTVGAVVATFGCILPSLILVTLLAYIYRKYRSLKSVQTILNTMRPAIAAIIVSAFLTILMNALMPAGLGFDLIALVMFSGCFIALRYFKMNAIVSMLCFGAIYTLVNLFVL